MLHKYKIIILLFALSTLTIISFSQISIPNGSVEDAIFLPSSKPLNTTPVLNLQLNRIGLVLDKIVGGKSNEKLLSLNLGMGLTRGRTNLLGNGMVKPSLDASLIYLIPEIDQGPDYQLYFQLGYTNRPNKFAMVENNELRIESKMKHALFIALGEVWNNNPNVIFSISLKGVRTFNSNNNLPLSYFCKTKESFANGFEHLDCTNAFEGNSTNDYIGIIQFDHFINLKRDKKKEKDEEKKRNIGIYAGSAAIFNSNAKPEFRLSIGPTLSKKNQASNIAFGVLAELFDFNSKISTENVRIRIYAGLPINL